MGVISLPRVEGARPSRVHHAGWPRVSSIGFRNAASEYIQVDGIIPFAHKRLFNLSLLGIEAKYVKLSFHVEKAGRMTRLGLYRDEKEQSGQIA